MQKRTLVKIVLAKWTFLGLSFLTNFLMVNFFNATPAHAVQKDFLVGSKKWIAASAHERLADALGLGSRIFGKPNMKALAQSRADTYCKTTASSDQVHYSRASSWSAKPGDEGVSFEGRKISPISIP